MGLLNFLFGSKKNKKAEVTQPPSRSVSKRTISYNGSFIEIPSVDFFGQFKKSNSGEWVICWSDSDDQQHRGGHRESGHGRYVLYNAPQDKIALQGKLERPNSGNVANNGCFSIEDWHFGSDLSGTFYVFSATGNQLIKKRLEANIFNSGISDSGHFAICQTANTPASEDGNRLTAFDVEKNIQLFSIHPTTGWADNYKFIEDTSHFAVVIDKIGTFRYDMQGSFVDAAKYDAARLRCDRFEVVLLAAEEILKAPELNNQRAQAALEAALRARSLGADKDQSWKAVALKIQGLAHEFLSNNEDALLAFDEALNINPKIGVKRKADSLRKKLTGHEKLS
jgi:hypothetical protein